MMNALHEGVSKQCSAEGLILDFLFPMPLALPLHWSGLRSAANDLNNVERGLGLFLQRRGDQGKNFITFKENWK